MIDWNIVKSNGWTQREPNNFRVLSIDGGGIRGIFPARYLSRIEESTGKKINEYFDLIVGTSTGGIIALALSIGIPAREIEELYINNAKEIFKPKLITSILRGKTVFLTQKYRNDRLAELLQEKFENKVMRDAQTMLCITSLEHTKAMPRVYKTPHNVNFHIDENIPMWKVALATSAAPTYFPPAKVNNDCKLDGGLWANNPILVGICEAINKGIPTERIKVLSIGTGEQIYSMKNKVAQEGGLFKWNTGIVDLVMNAQAYSSNNMASYLLEKDNFKRVNFTAGRKLGLDSIKAEDLTLLSQQADDQFANTFMNGVDVRNTFFSL